MAKNSPGQNADDFIALAHAAFEAADAVESALTKLEKDGFSCMNLTELRGAQRQCVLAARRTADVAARLYSPIRSKE